MLTPYPAVWTAGETQLQTAEGTGRLKAVAMQASAGMLQCIGRLHRHGLPNSINRRLDRSTAAALPEHLAVLDPARLQEKPMPTAWITGQTLGFDLITRPIRRLNAPLGRFAKGAELDAFLDHVLHMHPDARPETLEANRAAIYLEWLGERFAGAARLLPDQSRLVQFQCTKAARGSAAQGIPDHVGT